MSEVLYEVDGFIATITLNAPERMNTISGTMLNELSTFTRRPGPEGPLHRHHRRRKGLLCRA
jgi:hypothetical protein